MFFLNRMQLLFSSMIFDYFDYKKIYKTRIKKNHLKSFILIKRNGTYFCVI